MSPTPADRLKDLADHVGDPWLAGQLAAIASDLQPRRPGRPKATAPTRERRRNELLRRVRFAAPFASLTGGSAAGAMRRSFLAYARNRYPFDLAEGRVPPLEPQSTWHAILELGFEELPEIKTLQNCFVSV